MKDGTGHLLYSPTTHKKKSLPRLVGQALFLIFVLTVIVFRRVP